MGRRGRIHRGSPAVVTGEGAIAARLGLTRSATKRLIEAGELATFNQQGCTRIGRAELEAFALRREAAAVQAHAADLARWADDGGANPVRD